MKFDIGAEGRLSGTVELPGDYRLTLAVMAFGMASGVDVSIIDPSPAPGVQSFRTFLESNGAKFSRIPGGFALQGKKYTDEITILSPEIPDEIFHCVVSSSLATSKFLHIVNGAKEKSSALKHLLPFLRNRGFRELAVSEEGNDVTLKGNGFNPSDSMSVGSAWEFEMVTAALLSAKKQLILRYPGAAVSHNLRLLNALGCSCIEEDIRSREEDELARRLARASGEKPLESSRFIWDCRPCTIRIPGDTALGAAFAGAAASLPKSDIIVTKILWEPGRRGFFEALRRMKVDIETKVKSPIAAESKPGSAPESGFPFETADVRIRWGMLEGIRVNPIQAGTMCDELPILGSVAVSAKGETVIHEPEPITFIDHSGDFKLLARGLIALGAHIGDFSGGIVVKGPSHELKGNLTDSGGRTGVVLALAVAGMSASGITSVFGSDENMFPIQEFLARIRNVKESDLF
jgi:3-phosphoshikimate 1-carboxyvinyltransferase